MAAACNGHVGIVYELLDCGADPNIQNKSGWTALTIAACRGDYDIVSALLGTGKTSEEDRNDAAVFAYGMMPINTRSVVFDTGETTEEDSKYSNYQDIVNLLDNYIPAPPTKMARK